MSAIDYLYVVIALLFVGGGIYYFNQINPATTGQSIPALELSAPAQIAINEPFSFQLRARNLENETITLFIDGVSTTQRCSQSLCEYSFPHTFSEAGAHQIKAVSANGIKASAAIHATQSQLVCLDGTFESACSTQKPLRCVSAKLIADCNLCGCPENQQCENNACVALEAKLSISNVAVMDAFVGSNGTVQTTIKNDSVQSTEGIFLIYIDISTATGQLIQSIPQQIRIQPLASGSIQSFSHTVPISADTAGVVVRLFSVNASYHPDKLLSTSARAAVHAVTDNVPPSPPAQLTYQIIGQQIQLEWSPSPSTETITYILYRQNAGTTAFTTFETIGTTSQTSYVLPSTAETLLYTVRAADAAGNLSSTPDPISVPGNAT